VHSSRGAIASDIHGVLTELELHAKRGRSSRPLYHASISPAPGNPMSDAEIAIAATASDARQAKPACCAVCEIAGEPATNGTR
jgi:hypothetical protein